MFNHISLDLLRRRCAVIGGFYLNPYKLLSLIFCIEVFNYIDGFMSGLSACQISLFVSECFSRHVTLQVVSIMLLGKREKWTH